MAGNVADAVARIKRDFSSLLQPKLIQDICRELGHTWRDRALDPVTTVWLFVRQVLEGNTACTHVSQWCQKGVTGRAFCDARIRLPLDLFAQLLIQGISKLHAATEHVPRWRGHRVFLLDGSSFSMPDTAELQKSFGQPGGQAKGCGFPVARLLAMFNAATGMITEVFALPLRSHEQSSADSICMGLKRGDVLVADRGFCSFVQLTLLAAAGVFGVLRIHQRVLVDFTVGRGYRTRKGSKRSKCRARPLPYSRWLRSLGVEDQIVSWSKPKRKPDWMSDEDFALLPDWLEVRELRYRVTVPGSRTRTITLATTLLDAQAYPAEALAALYGTRWDIEINFRHLKQTMRMDVLKCKTHEGILKELMVFCLIYNLVRRVMCESAALQDVASNRISFIDALRWLQDGMQDGCLGKLVVLPARPSRVQPRVRKRRPKQYPLMQEPRSVLKQRLLGQ